MAAFLPWLDLRSTPADWYKPKPKPGDIVTEYPGDGVWLAIDHWPWLYRTRGRNETLGRWISDGLRSGRPDHERDTGWVGRDIASASSAPLRVIEQPEWYDPETNTSKATAPKG